MTFENFKNIIRNGEAKGEIKTSVPLTDFDLAIQWAIGNISERKGYPCDITVDEIWQEIHSLCEADVQGIADFLNSCTEYASTVDDIPQKGCYDYSKSEMENIKCGNGITTEIPQTDCPWK